MIIRYWNKFISLIIDSRDIERTSRLLGVIIRFGVVLGSVAGLAILLLPPARKTSLDLITITSILLLNLVANWLRQRGHSGLSAFLLVFSMGCVITLIAIASPGFFRIPLIGYIIVILTASLLLSRLAGFITFFLSVISSGLIIYAKESGLIQVQPVFPDPVSTWIVTATIFIWALYLILVSDWVMRQTIIKAEDDERKLDASFKDLNIARTSLEAYSHDLERRIIQLQVAADIASDAATLLEVDVLLDRAVNLVRDRFGFYHAGIFMIDEQGEYAILKAATGEAGKAMLAAGHKLKVGEVGIVGYVTGTGQPRIALDVGSDAVYFQNPNLPHTRSEMALPLKRGGVVIGALDVQSQEPAAFDEEDVTILQTMADQLATAIENARLFEATRQQVEELTALHAVATAGAEATSEDELIERATQMIAEVFFPDNFGVLLVNEKTGMLHHHPSYREPATVKHEPILIGKGVVGLTISEGKPCRISDVSSNPAYLPIDPGTQSELCVPIKVDERILGVINAESRHLAHFSAEDERLLATFAGQLGLAIKKVRLLEAERRRSSELEALRLASLHLTSNLEFDRLLAVLLDQAIRMSEADVACLFLYDGNTLTFGSASWAEGYPNELIGELQPDELTYQVARTGKQVVVTDARTDPIYADHAWDGSIISMPICTGPKVLGVMNLSYYGGTHEFDEHELRALALLTDQAAIAIINANLYSQIQDRARQLAEALQQREELDRMKNEFIQNVSHELRTPLAITRGYTDLLDNGELGPLNNEQSDAVKILSRRIKFLSQLVDDLVLILEAEGRDLTREQININELIIGVVQDFKAAATKAELALQANFPDEMVTVQGNYAHLNRLMDNLIGNAIKFTPRGGSVTVILEYSEDEAIIRVVDTGIGIEPEKITHIFERFYQVDGSTRRRFGGIGLGLSLAKEITAAHGGSISVQSQLGQGSTFTVHLPRHNNTPSNIP